MVTGIPSLEFLRRSRPACDDCSTDDALVRMEATTVYSEAWATDVDAWECPECGKAVVRGDAPALTTADGDRL